MDMTNIKALIERGNFSKLDTVDNASLVDRLLARVVAYSLLPVSNHSEGQVNEIIRTIDPIRTTKGIISELPSFLAALTPNTVLHFQHYLDYNLSGAATMKGADRTEISRLLGQEPLRHNVGVYTTEHCARAMWLFMRTLASSAAKGEIEFLDASKDAVITYSLVTSQQDRANRIKDDVILYRRDTINQITLNMDALKKWRSLMGTVDPNFDSLFLQRVISPFGDLPHRLAALYELEKEGLFIDYKEVAKANKITRDSFLSETDKEMDEVLPRSLLLEMLVHDGQDRKALTDTVIQKVRRGLTPATNSFCTDNTYFCRSSYPGDLGSHHWLVDPVQIQSVLGPMSLRTNQTLPGYFFSPDRLSPEVDERRLDDANFVHALTQQTGDRTVQELCNKDPRFKRALGYLVGQIATEEGAGASQFGWLLTMPFDKDIATSWVTNRIRVAYGLEDTRFLNFFTSSHGLVNLKMSLVDYNVPGVEAIRELYE